MTIDTNDEINEQLLSLIGYDAFYRLCVVFGGIRLYISGSIRSRQRLNIIVGEKNAEKMITRFMGTTFSFPILTSIESKKRSHAILEDARKGMSHREIAIKYDITERLVRRVISES